MKSTFWMTAQETEDELKSREITPKAKPIRVKMVCLECGHKKSVSPNAIDPRCSCGSVDLDVV